MTRLAVKPWALQAAMAMSGDLVAVTLELDSGYDDVQMPKDRIEELNSNDTVQNLY